MFYSSILYLLPNVLPDNVVLELCDAVENELEVIVIQFRGHFFEEGMEEKIRAQFESRLSILLEKKGINFDELSSEQHNYIQNRINTALELFKKEYES